MDAITNFHLPFDVKYILDGLVVLIALLCAWRGWRKGIIGGLCSILAVVVAFYGANLIATTYSSEFTGVVEPFSNGIVDSVINKVTGKNDSGEEQSEEGKEEGEEEGSKKWELVVPLSDEEKLDVYSVSFSALRQLGFHEEVASSIAKKAAEVSNLVNSDLSQFLAERLSSVIAYVAVFVIAFVLISILFVVLGNILDLVFELPGIELVNRFLGLALGLGKAFCILQFLGFLTRYIGIVIPEKSVAATYFFKYFVEYNYLAAFLGI